MEGSASDVTRSLATTNETGKLKLLNKSITIVTYTVPFRCIHVFAVFKQPGTVVLSPFFPCKFRHHLQLDHYVHVLTFKINLKTRTTCRHKNFVPALIGAPPTMEELLLVHAVPSSGGIS